MKDVYPILLIVVIVGILAMSSLTLLASIDQTQKLTGEDAWGSKSCDCKGNKDCESCCKDIYGSCDTKAKCDACSGVWKEEEP